jgi:hypothetical protein
MNNQSKCQGLQFSIVLALWCCDLCKLWTTINKAILIYALNDLLAIWRFARDTLQGCYKRPSVFWSILLLDARIGSDHTKRSYIVGIWIDIWKVADEIIIKHAILRRRIRSARQCKEGSQLLTSNLGTRLQVTTDPSYTTVTQHFHAPGK